MILKYSNSIFFENIKQSERRASNLKRQKPKHLDFIEYLILFSSVLLGGGLAFYFQKNNKALLQLVLSFSGAFILGISVLHLMPVAFSNEGNQVGMLILLGFFVQLLLEQLSKGVEHGHIHAGHNHDHLLLGIILHKAPAAFALVLLFLMSGFKKPFIWISVMLFAAMSPLGAFVGEYLAQQGFLTTENQNYIVAFVVGSFLHIATTILFETDSNAHHKIPLKKLVAILVGLGMALMTMH